MKQPIGKNTLGQGGKLTEVELEEFNRSTHNMGYLWKSTMAAGTLVPFYNEIVLPGDKKEINLGALVNTHPTIGPLFGKYKLQLDMFIAPIRLYHAWLQTNKPKVGLSMDKVKLPYMRLYTKNYSEAELRAVRNPDTYQINPSCILAYQGIRGIGTGNPDFAATSSRDFTALKLLLYWDIHYNYYANKQEDKAYVVHTTPVPPEENVSTIKVDDVAIPHLPTSGAAPLINGSIIKVETSGTQDQSKVMIQIDPGILIPVTEIGIDIGTVGSITSYSYKWAVYGNRIAEGWDYAKATDPIQTQIELAEFDLENINEMKQRIMANAAVPTAFRVDNQGLTPYSYLFERDDESGFASMQYNMEGLAVKTYQSDILQNWINKEFVDGAGGIKEVTAVSTAAGSFTIDALNLAEKLYKMLNSIAVSDGSYTSWLNVVYNERISGIISPVFCGGLVKSIVFEQLVSTAESAPTDGGGAQPLGTLAGKGTVGDRHVGGTVELSANELSIAMGIVSITPELDYSQGNSYDSGFLTADDFHKPHLDGIAFQELITEQMAHWDTYQDETGVWRQKSAGKQPAWLWYMTNHNKVYGNFAIQENEGWMILNRGYEPEVSDGKFKIKDLTTYIDPRKFNNIWANRSIDSMDFWVQISVEDTTRRKISARVMPNL